MQSPGRHTIGAPGLMDCYFSAAADIPYYFTTDWNSGDVSRLENSLSDDE
jgi:hypothetical protein